MRRRRSLLDGGTIAAALVGRSWSLDDDSLVLTREFPSFRDAIAYVCRVADVAESMDHHPDIDVRWRTVVLRVSTHSSRGVTQVDLDFADAVDRLD